jgi:hypothetical protein
MIKLHIEINSADLDRLRSTVQDCNGWVLSAFEDKLQLNNIRVKIQFGYSRDLEKFVSSWWD